MPDSRHIGTILRPARFDQHWRVQMAWPNGVVRYVGRFDSELEATKWIARHRSLGECGKAIEASSEDQVAEKSAAGPKAAGIRWKKPRPVAPA